ncbi:hypothetical protein Q73_06745 [Bacillus coahuilensis m2-6]|uniref:lytic transglycosylase domain-containing protein n=1 Tax=Bacillus coahuilensis TaxID=408580 RepID=UPI00075043A8|nr:lytic transglycosylase domain-containing protein [Bacillus coahuilensis]KUP08213.1 hypothetical protein Q73_06745 [Bacillus coahuilensis m2-6]
MSTSKNKKSKSKSFSITTILALPFILLGVYFVLDENVTDTMRLAQSEYVPDEYIPIYQQAEEMYGVPWELLAAHHRVETRFSTMSSMVSPVGAVGHLQFMPCTFVGWTHPTCGGLGEGSISSEELTDLKTIEKYGGYGVDGNGDGYADPWNLEDAVFSAANYLANYGADSGKIEEAIFAYNHSHEYVDEVMYYMNLYTN